MPKHAGFELVGKPLWAFPTVFCSLLRAYRRSTRHNVPFPASRKFHLCPDFSSPHKASMRFMGSPFLLLANKFYTCSLRSVFAHVQEVNCPKGARETTLGCAAVENDFILFSACAENSAKPFLTVCRTAAKTCCGPEYIYTSFIGLLNKQPAALPQKRSQYAFLVPFGTVL